MSERNLVSWTAMVTGFSQNLHNLVDMYSKCGLMINAYKVFQEMEGKDEVLWTALIDGYAKNALKVVNFGKCLHSVVVKKGFELEISVGNALTDMYSKVGDMDSASNVSGIDSGCRNIVSCSSLIDGYVEMDQMEEAFSVFVELRRRGIESNEFTFSSLIKACASEAALELGLQLHAQVIKFSFDGNPFFSSVLVDMYGKCGLLDDSIWVFDEIENATEIAWNSMLSVFAQHGLGKDAIEIFNRVKNGVEPNEVTFVSLLRGCSHSGLVEEGLSFFNAMEKTYGVVPREEHYSCVIDLLGRAGQLKEAEELINKMPFEPNAFGWCSFLGACKIYGDKERCKLAAEKLIQLEPENSGAPVLLSNIYAKEQQWEDVRTLRKMMQDGNVKKLPGYSWVDVGNKTHIFGVEDRSHPQKKAIYEKLDALSDQIKKAGYAPCTDSFPLDMDVSMKEKMLQHHSERIAIAFALISMPSGKPIIVKKNLRVCMNCHSAIKYISKVVRRKILVRDNSRFHHFSDGLCSCGDFWLRF
ncbi:hypothetical protein DITRI_Ditri12bG0135800 [Diplodiscus trichospermus]